MAFQSYRHGRASTIPLYLPNPPATNNPFLALPLQGHQYRLETFVAKLIAHIGEWVILESSEDKGSTEGDALSFSARFNQADSFSKSLVETAYQKYLVVRVCTVVRHKATTQGYWWSIRHLTDGRREETLPWAFDLI